MKRNNLFESVLGDLNDKTSNRIVDLAQLDEICLFAMNSSDDYFATLAKNGDVIRPSLNSSVLENKKGTS